MKKSKESDQVKVSVWRCCRFRQDLSFCHSKIWLHSTPLQYTTPRLLPIEYTVQTHGIKDILSITQLGICQYLLILDKKKKSQLF